MVAKNCCGYAGKILRVDLSKNKIWAESTEKYAKRFIGGRGINQWILFNETSPSIDWLDPENIIIYGVGALVGTMMPCASRLSIDTKNVFNNGVGSANVGGCFPTELKLAGFDHIVIKGKSKKPVFLWVHDGQAELKDATPIWGKTTWETEEIIRNDLGDKKIKISSIGPAGENLVRASAIINDRCHAAGGSGVGAVLGSKKLKAIAARGVDRPKIANLEKFEELKQKIISKINSDPNLHELRRWGFYGISSQSEAYRPIEWGYRPVKNGQDDYWDPKKVEKTGGSNFKKFVKGTISCSSCPLSCIPIIEITEGHYKTRGEGFWNNHHNSFCTQIDNDNLEAAIYAAHLSNQLGLDTDNVAKVIAWAFECYEKGLIKKEDTGGLELKWGNVGAMIELLTKIAYRKGIGQLLADGAKRASEKLGGGSEHFAICIKGQDSLDGVRISKGWGFGIVTSTCAGRHLRGAATSEPVTSYDGVPERVFSRECYKAVIDSIGICAYALNQSIEDYSAVLSSVTGLDYSPTKLLKIGRQVQNIEKAFNTLHAGFTRKDDYPPERYYSEPVKSGPHAGEKIDHDEWERMLDKYYALHGWDRKTSWQTKECLYELDLPEVAEKLEKAKKIKLLSKEEKSLHEKFKEKIFSIPYRWY